MPAAEHAAAASLPNSHTGVCAAGEHWDMLCATDEHWDVREEWRQTSRALRKNMHRRTLVSSADVI